MNCERPIRIRNPYSGKWMYVPCRHCDACKIAQANRKAVELEACAHNYKYMYFLTLSYAPEYVPYVIDGISYIMRGKYYEIIEDLPFCVETGNSPLLQNHHCDAVGVIYPRDFQLFMKRFRKFINKNYGKREIKYFAAFEYGSKRGRPHVHVLLLSNDLTFAECRTSAFENWKYHDWSQFENFETGVNESCKVCDKSTSYYLASYCNCNNSDNPISQIHDFRPRTIRSKEMAFGMHPSELQIFREGVQRIANNDFGSTLSQDRKPFFYFDLSKQGSPALSLVSKKYIDAAFSKPKGFFEMAFGDFLSRARCIVALVGIRERRGLSKFGEFDETGLKPQDLNFYRKWKNHEKVLGLRLCLSEYCRLFWLVCNYFASCLLYMQMVEYEAMTNKDDYVLQQIDTYVEDLSRKRWFVYRHLHSVYRKSFMTLSLECPPFQRRQIDIYTTKYRKRLLKKHLNDVNNVLFKF